MSCGLIRSITNLDEGTAAINLKNAAKGGVEGRWEEGMESGKRNKNAAKWIKLMDLHV